MCLKLFATISNCSQLLEAVRNCFQTFRSCLQLSTRPARLTRAGPHENQSGGQRLGLFVFLICSLTLMALGLLSSYRSRPAPPSGPPRAIYMRGAPRRRPQQRGVETKTA
jgi:hypothetical protein